MELLPHEGVWRASQRSVELLCPSPCSLFRSVLVVGEVFNRGLYPTGRKMMQGPTRGYGSIVLLADHTSVVIFPNLLLWRAALILIPDHPAYTQTIGQEMSLRNAASSFEDETILLGILVRS